MIYQDTEVRSQKNKLKYLFFILVILLVNQGFSQDKSKLKNENYIPFRNVDTLWVDSVFKSLTLEQRIGQLFMIAVRSDFDHEKKYIENISDLICNYNIGGIMFLKGGPVRQARMTNYFQSWAKTPLLISMDAEWGLSMRLDSVMSFPVQMALGAIQNDSLIYSMGAEIARQCKRIGVHISFSPDIDVNNNPLNPVINFRSFGEDKYEVSKKGILYMNGLQDYHIIATAKHFPGHGDTESDSHLTLPFLKQSRKRLDTLELFPFTKLINNGILGVMVAHLDVPALDSSRKTPTSLSNKVITGILKNELGFKGLVFSDALNMKGVTSCYKPGKIEVKALLAGNDVLLYPEDVQKAICEIELSIMKGDLTIEDIDRRCKKILAAKYWVGLNHYKPSKIECLLNDLNSSTAELINRRMVEQSITLLKNKNNIIPIKGLDTLCIASLSVDESEITPFQTMLGKYALIDNYNIMSNIDSVKSAELTYNMLKYNLVIVGIHSTTSKPSKNYGLSNNIIELIDSISKKSKVIVDIFGSPYMLNNFRGVENVDGVVVSYQDKDINNEISAQVIFGGLGVNGKLPVTASSTYQRNSGMNIEKQIRYEYTIPEDLGIKSIYTKKIDSLALNGINKKAYPGCQIVIAWKGKVFYYKSFGFHSYDLKEPVINSDIYDLASLTKVLSTTLATMKLDEQGKINIQNKVSDYLPILNNSNKKKIIIKDVLTHQASLLSWIPFYKKTIDINGPLKRIYNTYATDTFPHRVAENLYIRKDYRDTIINQIIESPLKKKKEYEYSDLGFYLMLMVVESASNSTLDNYVENNFYLPMGLSTMTYNPRNKFDISRIPPTENDKDFRKQIIQGDVHDPGAAMLGGVSGHAGLFASANDVAKLAQMYLQKGVYADKKYLSSETVDKYTKCQFCEIGNRRGLGFDRPSTNPSLSPCCKDASQISYGHTGFTGTYVWIDPEYDLVYVFLSNRVCPDAENKKLANMNIRTDIQQVIYDAIKQK